MKPKHEHYVNCKDLLEEIKLYNKTRKVSEELGVYLLKIAKRYATKPNFSGYTYKDDFIADAVYRMVEQLDKINLNHPKCNPFSYLTQLCRNCFIAKINKEHRIQNTKENIRDTVYSEFIKNEDINES